MDSHMWQSWFSPPALKRLTFSSTSTAADNEFPVSDRHEIFAAITTTAMELRFFFLGNSHFFFWELEGWSAKCLPFPVGY